MKLYTLRELARKTKDNPKGEGIIPIHYNNLRQKVDKTLIATKKDTKPRGYNYYLFSQESVDNYLNRK